MDLIGYLNVVRRRWPLVVVTTGLTLLVVWLTLPSTSENRSSTITYSATTTLIADPSATQPFNLATAALFTTVGEVPERATARLGVKEEPQALAAGISTSADPETGTLTITSTGDRPAPVARTANVFAEELIAYYQRDESQGRQAQLRALNERIARYAEEISRLDRQIARRPQDSTLVAKRDGLRSYYQGLVTSAATLDQGAAVSAPMTVLEPAVALPQATPGFTPPSSPINRLAVGGLLGLALALALALVVERLDSRIRSREQAEDAFGLPVLAEIPRRPWQRGGSHTVLSAEAPGSATAEAFRALRSALLLLRQEPSGEGGPESHAPQGPTVVLVTSARPADGKSTTVANLATVMAESGRSVLVLSMDFRHPRIHDYLDVPDGAGLSDLLDAGRGTHLADVVRDTAFPGVRIATSGHETNHPGALLAGAGPLISRARQLADVVLVDTTPLLTVSDAVDLSPHVDAVLVVARVNRTTTIQAQAVHRLLSRLHVPALGSVLIGAGGAHADGGYGPPVSIARQVALYLRGNRRPDSDVDSVLTAPRSGGGGA